MQISLPYQLQLQSLFGNPDFERATRQQAARSMLVEKLEVINMTAVQLSKSIESGEICSQHRQALIDTQVALELERAKIEQQLSRYHPN